MSASDPPGSVLGVSGTRLLLAALLVALCGCVGERLPDAMAGSLEATRPGHVRAIEALAATAERLPPLLERTVASSGALGDGAAHVASSTALAIQQLAELLRRTGELADSAAEEAKATRADRERLLAGLAAMATSGESLLARADEVAGTWQKRAEVTQKQQERLLEGLAGLAEASAAGAADLAATTGRVGPRLEEHVVGGAESLAAILKDLREVSARLSRPETSVTLPAVLIGLGSGLAVLLLGLLLRRLFDRAVDLEVKREVSRRIG